jgi:hypothetical protein
MTFSFQSRYGGSMAPQSRLALALAAALATAVPAAAQPSTQTFTGPAVVCGAAFALRIAAGERVERRDPGIDFLLYYAQARDGPFVIYEGNAPMAHDDSIRTGLSFPAVIAIHDSRAPAAKARSRIRDRLLTGEAFRAACRAGVAR